MEQSEFDAKQAEVIDRVEGVIKNVLGEEGRVFVIVAHGRAATVGGNMSKRAAIAVMKHLVETFEAEQANEKLEEQN